MNMIRPVSDLRNNFAEISKTVHETAQPVFLTKNGYGDDGRSEYGKRLKICNLKARFTSNCRPPSAKQSCPANAIPPRTF